MSLVEYFNMKPIKKCIVRHKEWLVIIQIKFAVGWNQYLPFKNLNKIGSPFSTFYHTNIVSSKKAYAGVSGEFECFSGNIKLAQARIICFLQLGWFD